MGTTRSRGVGMGTRCPSHLAGRSVIARHTTHKMRTCAASAVQVQLAHAAAHARNGVCKAKQTAVLENLHCGVVFEPHCAQLRAGQGKDREGEKTKKRRRKGERRGERRRKRKGKRVELPLLHTLIQKYRSIGLVSRLMLYSCDHDNKIMVMVSIYLPNDGTGKTTMARILSTFRDPEQQAAVLIVWLWHVPGYAYLLDKVFARYLDPGRL